MEKPQQGLLNKPDPRLQEQVDIFVSNGIQIIHNQRLSGNLIKQLKNSKDPVDTISAATLKVIEMLEADAEKKGAKLQDATKINGANQLMGEIINLAETSKAIEPLTDEQKYQAFSLALSTYLDKAVTSGKMSKEQLMAHAEEAQQTPEGQKIAQELQGGQAPGVPGQAQGQNPGVPGQPNAQMMRR